LVNPEFLTQPLQNYWYAVAFASQVGPTTLKGFELLGQPWVLFRNQEGHVGCIADTCAHRACPLSLGKVVDGAVQCAYHGWEFDTQGQCRQMPSCRHLKISVASLPCTEAGGLVWVWPGNQEPTALPQPVQTIPDGFALQTELEHRYTSRALKKSSYPRSHNLVAMNQKFGDISHFWTGALEVEIPVEHGLFLDNLLDLAHAPFTHQGTFAKGWTAPEMVKFLTPPQNSLTGHWDPYPIEMTFEPPCYLISTIGFRGQRGHRHLHQIHCCLPVNGHKTRLLYRLSLDFFTWARFIPGKDRFWRFWARKVLQEDFPLVQGQQARMEQGANVWNMPVAYDRLGVGYRRWRKQIEKQVESTSLDV
jgi:chlorophyllide a oxygenase